MGIWFYKNGQRETRYEFDSSSKASILGSGMRSLQKQTSEGTRREGNEGSAFGSYGMR